MTSDWFPTRRLDQILMAKNWEHQFEIWGEAWGVPKMVREKLITLRKKAEAEILRATSENPTRGSAQRSADALKELEAHMRDIKDRYFKKPPLENEHFIELGLNMPDTIRSPIPRPEGRSTAVISYPGSGQLCLHLSHVKGTEPDKRVEYGRSIHWGIMPQGGATLEQAAGKGHYLMKPSASGDELVHSKFTRRSKETIEFPPEDSGSTAYFCIRYENSKGEPGPWGPVISGVIP